ncbi:MAG: sulfatase-like hydrolase/transferase [Acidobacteriota bacterium]
MKVPFAFGLALLLAVSGMAVSEGVDSDSFVDRPSPRPNLLVIMVDDLDTASFQQLLDGGKLPNIRKHLLLEGTEFRESFASNSLCCPSRATFLTGQYAHNHGVQNVTGSNGGYRAFHPGGADHPNVADWLQESGYYTGLIGKYKNGYTPSKPVPSGWDYWRALPSHLLVPGSYTVVREDGGTERPEVYQTRKIGEYAMEAMGRAASAGEPFFLFLAPTAPHVETLSVWDNDYQCNGTTHPNYTGYLKPDAGNFDSDPVIEGYSRADYAAQGCSAYAEGCLRGPGNTPLPGFELPSLGSPSFDNFASAPAVAQDHWESLSCADNLDQLQRLHLERQESMLSIDVMVGKLIGGLIDTDQLDDTVIVFTSDNGYFLGQHSLGNKGLAYEESIRVPLLIRPLGPRIHAWQWIMVGNVDLAPTLLQYAGLDWTDPMYGIDGRSLWLFLEVAFKAMPPWRDMLFLEAEHPRGSNLEGPQSWWMFPDYAAVRTATGSLSRGDMTLVEYNDPLWKTVGYYEEFLFDMKSDPHQILDVSADPAYALDLQTLRGKLDDLETCAGAGCRSAERW